MVEPMMYLAIGFLVASLLGLVLIPLVHNRAVRLTTKRLEAATPVSMAEIQADKDQLRAEFAMSTRRLEMSVEQLKAKTTGQLTELGKKTDAIHRLKSELGEKTAAILALEAREKSLRDQIRNSEEEISIKSTTLHETQRTLADKEADLARITSELGERTYLSDGQRVEIVALRTQVDSLKGLVDRMEGEIKDTEERLTRERVEAEAATRVAHDGREEVHTLEGRVFDLDRQLLAQTKEAELLARRLLDLEGRLTEQGRALAEREFEASQLRAELGRIRQVETQLRTEVATVESRHSSAGAHLRSEKAVLEQELRNAIEEREKAERELAAIKRDAEATWAAERVENALLRERINDIATEVVRLTMVLEGPNSPIESILAEVSAPANGGGNGRLAVIGNGHTADGNLGDRIRALQSRASRVAPAG
jgi:chromosome segregation ATPase